MSEQVIWERPVDHEKIRVRKQRFLKRFLTLAAIVLLTVIILAGTRNAIGALIVLAGIGLAWGNVVRYQSLSDQANPTIIFDGTRLKVGNRDVMVEDIKRYSTLATSLQTSLLGKYSRIDIGKAVFRLDNPAAKGEPELVEFGWPNMGEDDVATVAAALEPILADRWVEPADLVGEDEIELRRRRRKDPI